jgi:HEAT repeat protein
VQHGVQHTAPVSLFCLRVCWDFPASAELVLHCRLLSLQEGALQPVINLLGSSCSESQREAALLLGQFATQTPNDDGPDYKSRIVQRGAVPPLIRMLSSPDTALKEMAAFALGRLAQNSHNQAGIVQVRCVEAAAGNSLAVMATYARWRQQQAQQRG